MIIVLILAVVLCALYAVWTLHYRKHWKENFQVELCFSEEQAGVGDTLFLYETAINKKKMKIPTICVKFGASKELAFEDMEHGTVSDQYYRNDVMSVDSFQKVRRKLKLTCKKRGLYHIRQAELVSYDLFCTQTFVHKLDVDATLCVYPSRMDVTKLLPVLSRQSGGFRSRQPLFEDPFAFAGVREYTPADSMRRIHWKASARTGTWQVKTTEYTASTPVVILLNLESPGVFTEVELMEDSITLAYSLAYYMCSHCIPVRLIVAGDETLRLEGDGQGMIDRIRRALALVSYKNPCCSGEELVLRELPHVQPQEHVILISAAGKKPMQKAVEEMLRVSDAVSWIFPTHAQYGEGNELRELSPAVSRCLVKWRGN